MGLISTLKLKGALCGQGRALSGGRLLLPRKTPEMPPVRARRVPAELRNEGLHCALARRRFEDQAMIQPLDDVSITTVGLNPSAFIRR